MYHANTFLRAKTLSVPLFRYMTASKYGHLSTASCDSIAEIIVNVVLQYPSELLLDWIRDHIHSFRPPDAVELQRLKGNSASKPTLADQILVDGDILEIILFKHSCLKSKLHGMLRQALISDLCSAVGEPGHFWVLDQYAHLIQFLEQILFSLQNALEVADARDRANKEIERIYCEYLMTVRFLYSCSASCIIKFATADPVSRISKEIERRGLYDKILNNGHDLTRCFDKLFQLLGPGEPVQYMTAKHRRAYYLYKNSLAETRLHMCFVKFTRGELFDSYETASNFLVCALALFPTDHPQWTSLISLITCLQEKFESILEYFEHGSELQAPQAKIEHIRLMRRVMQLETRIFGFILQAGTREPAMKWYLSISKDLQAVLDDHQRLMNSVGGSLSNSVFLAGSTLSGKVAALEPPSRDFTMFVLYLMRLKQRINVYGESRDAVGLNTMMLEKIPRDIVDVWRDTLGFTWEYSNWEKLLEEDEEVSGYDLPPSRWLIRMYKTLKTAGREDSSRDSDLESSKWHYVVAFDSESSFESDSDEV